MSVPQTIAYEPVSTPITDERTTGPRLRAELDLGLSARLAAGFPRPDPALQERDAQRAARSTLDEGVLSAARFAALLERERSLADRGSRRFCLLVLERCVVAEDAGRARLALGMLAQQLSGRLRSSDFVGRPHVDRIEVLLADTEPSGAQVVASWVRQAELGLRLELLRTIFVYPLVQEPPGGLELEDVSARGAVERVTTRTAWPVRGGHAVNALRVIDPSAPACPLQDLWPRLAAPPARAKRALDLTLATLALVTLAPVFALVALAIRLESPGPVIFRQVRAGRGARPFVFYKFRSMGIDAERQRASLEGSNEQSGPVFKMRADPRLTRIGGFLRRWSLDELPQLWNVVKGDLSLVGPRSPTFDEVAQYERWQRRRLAVTGGLTCLWQVSGRSRIGFVEWMRLDLRYVSRHGLALDLALLLRTLPAVMSGRGAC